MKMVYLHVTIIQAIYHDKMTQFSHMFQMIILSLLFFFAQNSTLLPGLSFEKRNEIKIHTYKKSEM